MFPMIRYYIRQNEIIIGLALVNAALIRVWTDTPFVFFQFLLVAALAYRFNTEERIKKSWAYFQSLPLTFWHKAVIKIAVPFIILTLLLGLSSIAISHNYAYPSQTMLIGFMNLAAPLVLSSLLAKSLIQFIILLPICILPLAAVDPSWLQITIIGLELGYAYYTLSEKRLNFPKTMMAAFLLTTPLAAADYQINQWLLQNMLKSPELDRRLDAARLLLNDNTNHAAARRTLNDALMEESLSSPALQRTLRMMDRHDIVADIPPARFWQLIEQDRTMREAIFEYLDDIKDEADWIHSLSFFQRAEAISLRGTLPCSDDCAELADLAENIIFNIEGGAEHIRSLLQTENLLHLDYALLILGAQRELPFREDLIALVPELAQKHPELTKRINDLLLEPDNDRFFENLGEEIRVRIEREINENLGPEERRRIKKELRRSLDIPEKDSSD
jgi:hypothetical protein